jgi:hypothetical protein
MPPSIPWGGYRLDIIGRGLTNGADLMIENQFGVTDHGHLGQVLTYAAGTGAQTVVWIARRFRDEHRQALDWLNEQSDQKTHFFGIEVCVGRIGDSVWAPLFEVVVQPNEWQKIIRQPGALEGRGAIYADFWPRLLERVRADHPDWTNQQPEAAARPDNAVVMRAPIDGANLYCSFSQRGLRHELYIDTGDPDTTREIFVRLQDEQDRLATEYGSPLTFDAIEGKRACRIADYLDGDVSQVERHDEFIDWFIDTGERRRRALAAVEGEPSARPVAVPTV